jgi:hypothetical protein
MLKYGLLLVLLWVVPVSAQAELTAKLILENEFVIDYPSDWAAEADAATGFVYLTSGNVQMTLYSPAVLANYQLSNYNPQMLVRLVLALNAVTPGEALEADSAEALRYENADTGHSGLLIAREFDDGLVGLIDAFAPAGLLDADLILSMAATFNTPPVLAPVRLENYAGPMPQVVAELEDSGLVPPGGGLVFAERFVFAAGINRTQPLAQSLALSDVIVAGTLTYRPSADPANETCGVIARLAGDVSGLEIGINSDHQLYFMDGDAQVVLASGVDAAIPHRVVMLALDARMIVYLDGELAADREIEAGSGYFGIRVRGSGAGAACEVRDLWVYRVPVIERGVCSIIASGGGVNQRRGPGTAFEIAGVLENGASAMAVAQAVGTDSLTWWQLEGGGWVREDVVTEQGGCGGLPVGG